MFLFRFNKPLTLDSRAVRRTACHGEIRSQSDKPVVRSDRGASGAGRGMVARTNVDWKSMDCATSGDGPLWLGEPVGGSLRQERDPSQDAGQTEEIVEMRYLTPLVLAVICGMATFSWLAAATVESLPKPAVPPSGRELATLVRELGDENFRVREQASRDIWALGEAALPALREALAADDPEQSFRARDLIGKIQLHITPATDATIIALVERYAKATPTEKTLLFAKLQVKHAWRQMLKLYASETHAEVRAKLQPSVSGVAVKAARECLIQGDARGARELLELAPADADGLLALAAFHRSQGTLDAELQRAQAVKGRNAQAWQLALRREAGTLEAAREAAMAAGEPRIAAALAALAGDPLPWLGGGPAAHAEGGPDLLAPSYAKVASKRWLGQKILPSDLEPLRGAMASRNPMERDVAINALFLLGEVKTAEAAMTKSSPLAAFHHFEALESIPEALQVLGLDPQHPDFKAWVAKRLQKVPTEDIEDQHEVSTQSEELVALANFLERRGLHDDAWAAYSEPMAAFANKEVNPFVNFLGVLFGNRDSTSGAPRLAKRVAFAWAGEDAKRWEEIVATAFGDDEQARSWWAWLVELDPKASRSERFDGMLALFGLGADPAKVRDHWLSMAWKAVAALPAAERQPLVSRLSRIAIAEGDVANTLKAWDQMSEASRKEVFWGEHLLHLSAVERWNEAATVLLDQIALDKDLSQEPSAQNHAYAAAALRLAGRPGEAATHDRIADQLALGDAATAILIGNGYAFGRDYARAAEWWARAAREANPDAREFPLALKLHSDTLLEAGRWQEAAATSEVLARVYLAANNRRESSLLLMRQRLQADTARALANLQSDRPAALALLAKCHQQFASDGSLADFFFPALRKVGLLKDHDRWFLESWNRMAQIIDAYPHSDNTRNTAAWFAARALRKLDEAEQSLTQALAANPNQSAYLDTMAEIQFAKGNRAQALAWSRQAVNFLPEDPQLRQQQERFRTAPLPK